MVHSLCAQTLTVRQIKMVLIWWLILFGLSACQTAQERVAEHNRIGETAFLQGRLEEAKTSFSQALSIDPSSETAHFWMARTHLRLGAPRQAMAHINAAVEAQPKVLPYLNLRSKILLSAGQIEPADDQTEASLRLDPNNPTANAMRAAFFVQLNQLDSALEFGEKALSIDPSNAEALRVLALLQLKSGNSDQALSLVDQGLSVDPNAIDLRSLRVDILRQMGRNAEVLQDYARLVKDFPQNIDYKRTLAVQYLEAELYDESEAVFRAIADDNPTSMDAQLDVVRMVNHAYGQSRAIAALKGLVQERPKLFGLHYAYCEAILGAGAVAEAAQYLQQLANADFSRSERATALALYGKIQLSRNDTRGTLSTVNRILELDNRHEQGLILSARLASRERRYDDAVESLRTALADAPLSPEAHTELGRVYELQGQYQLASEQYSEAANNAGRDIQPVLNYVDYLRRRRQYDQAERTLVRRLNDDRGRIALLEQLARIRILRKDWTAARETLLDLARNGADPSISQPLQAEINASETDETSRQRAFMAASGSLPSNILPLVGLVGSYVRSQEFDKAAQLLTDVIDRESEQTVYAYVLLAQVRTAQGAKTEAETLLNKAMDLEPDSIYPIQSAYQLYRQTNNIPAAERILARANAEGSNYASVQFLKADLSSWKGQPAKAIEIYEDLNKRFPNVDIVKNNLASLLLERSDEADLKRGRDLASSLKDSRVSSYQDTYGWSLIVGGQISEGIRVLEGAEKASPDDAYIPYHLGLGYQKQGDKQQARRALLRAQARVKEGDRSLKDKIETALKTI